jgi:hypothetical protein
MIAGKESKMSQVDLEYQGRIWAMTPPNPTRSTSIESIRQTSPLVSDIPPTETFPPGPSQQRFQKSMV